MVAINLEEMKAEFLAEFDNWWPFAEQHLTKGGRVRFSISLEMTRPGRYFVQGSIDSSSKVAEKVGREEPAA